MNLSDLAIVIGLTTSITVPTATGLKYYADHEYVPVGQFNDAFLQKDIRDLRRELRRLERIPDPTEQELWEIQDLTDELHDLQQELE